MLERSYLLDKLSVGKFDRMILISGQAGTGKTSLISQWVIQNDLPVAWYSLDETDNDPDLFYRYLLEVLSKKSVHLAEGFGPFLQSSEKLSAKKIFPFVIEYLDSLTKDLYLVLDDYHHITSEAIHEAVEHLLRYLPPKMHVIIISRHNVPFSLSSFRIRNQATEIMASDLQLTDSESELFLSEIMNIRLTHNQLQELIKYTEGWIGGLQMIGLSLRERSNLNNFKDILPRAGRLTAEYLIDETMKVQPDDVRAFIFNTVLLNKFNVELCQQVTGRDDAIEILDYLIQTNLFIVPLDIEGTWYRYHNLFSEALRKRVKKSSDQNPSEIYRKAAIWFAKHHYMEEAFQHAFEVDSEFAADLMEDYLPMYYDQYDVSSALRWFSKLPRHIIMQRGLLRLDECNFKIFSQDLEGLEIILKNVDEHKERAFGRYTGYKKKRCLKKLFYLKYFLPYLRDPSRVNIDYSFEGFQQIPANDHFFHGNIHTLIAQNQIYQGNILQAESALKEAETSVFSSRSIFLKVLWNKTKSDQELWKGNLRGAELIIEKAIQSLRSDEIDQSHLRFFLYLPIASISYLHNDLEKALHYAERSLRNAELTKHVNGMISAYFLLAQIYLSIGELDKASLSLKCLQDASITNTQSVAVFGDIYSVIISIVIGDLRTPEKWVEQRNVKLDEPFSILYYFESLAYALLVLQKKKYSEAVKWLRVLRARCLKRNILLAVFHIDLLLSAALFASGEQGEAKSVMEEAIVFAEKEGCIRPFADYWRFVSPVLMDISEKHLYNQNDLFLEKIFDACGIAQDSSIRTKLADRDRTDLSQREMEILQLISLGYRNKEIAEKAFISLSTVKTHISHILQKLGVKTRVQAITRAQEMKFFS